MSTFENRQQYDDAVHAVTLAAAAYYDSETVTMVDADYDHLVDMIAVTREIHPDWDDQGVTSKVSAGQSAGGNITHPTPMLSLEKVADTNSSHNGIDIIPDLTRFLDRAGRTGYTVEVKLDGNAVRVVYENGHLVRAVTRGDGRTGEDITHNIKLAPGVQGLPERLATNWTGEVRGEIFMTDEDFETASMNRLAAGGKPFANPRNATSGCLRTLDRTYQAPMSFGLYSIEDKTTPNIDTHTARMEYAENLGFTTAAALTPADSYAPSSEDVYTRIVDIKTARDTLGYPIDGAVITYNGDTDRERVGEGNRTPKWALAWKYPPRETESILRDIEIAVGRTGRVSLTAHIDPVALDGTTVSKASGHNIPWLTATGLGIGHRVMIVKKGDIIPYISKLDGNQPTNVTPWEPPATCPQCDQPWDTSSLLWRCLTPSCSLVGAITFAAARDQLDIEGLGETVAEALVKNGLVKNIADIYELSQTQLATLPLGKTTTGNTRYFGELNASKLMAAIQQSKTQPFNRVIGSLGIRMTGRSVSRWLAREYPTMDKLRNATVEEIAGIERMGNIKAQSVVDGLANMGDVIDRLTTHGLNMGEEPDQATPQPFTGHTYVVSGSVSGYTRTEIAEVIERLGGRASSSVSKNTTALVTVETDTSKAKKAHNLNIPIIDPEEFVNRINSLSSGN